MAMMGAAAGAISAGGGLIGQGIGYALSGKLQKRQFSFIRDMSNTAYQRAARDLEKAGLNRILAISGGGSGATTPPGSAQQVSSASSVDISRAMSEAAMRELTSAQTGKAYSESAAAEQRGLLDGSLREEVDTRVRLLKLKLPGATSESEFDASTAGQMFRKWKRAQEALPSMPHLNLNLNRGTYNPRPRKKK